MAPLQVIGAGYGRTGTDSLREALNILGYNCHHMRELLAQDRNPEIFLEAYQNPDKPADWDKAYEGFDAAVDWPTASFVEPLLKKYPDAKWLLTDRDPDSWYKSVKNTIHEGAASRTPEEIAALPEYLQRTFKMAKTVVMDGALGDAARFADEEAMKENFRNHYEWVKKTIPADRLLVLQLGEGWDRLCEFLGKPVPDVPYPRSNSTANFRNEFLKTFDPAKHQQDNQTAAA
ncbi:hypothetical protein O0I10_000549 [Lichtheimia ornata]|uniref:P-loop containing nucleoside triphosphate hydrolase protein n=1 Tax=Lichtheimia ornata TaxID=688661 RepID=A0AAD7Y3V3_9FUNG|nr:uncharacterized protein O0I10_000549 [Lichtheimia ornata]KAJ8663310.1 hypothetical protein O0I10_000549 [Lichtheimia ornata]